MIPCLKSRLGPNGPSFPILTANSDFVLLQFTQSHKVAGIKNSDRLSGVKTDSYYAVVGSFIIYEKPMCIDSFLIGL